jgi:hypothetical protein
MKLSMMCTSFLGMAGLLFAGQAQAASADSNSLQKVITALTITYASNLDFGTAVAGDAAKTVAADVVENDENASFSVVGEPFYNYAIQLPADNTVIMKKGAGGTPDTEIPVNGFDSFPMGLGSLDSNGRSTLLVGATRDALAATQESGDYIGTFTVNVVYP